MLEDAGSVVVVVVEVVGVDVVVVDVGGSVVVVDDGAGWVVVVVDEPGGPVVVVVVEVVGGTKEKRAVAQSVGVEASTTNTPGSVE